MKEKEKELENNIYFWQKLDTLVFSSKKVIDRPKGSRNKHYTSMIYPVDAGYLKDTFSSEIAPIEAYFGSEKTHEVGAIIVQADILARDCIVKFLIGCTDEECATILKFINATEFQKAILIRRGSETPSWAISE